MRSHYVVTALRAKCDINDIVSVCRWADQKIIETYRLKQMECTVEGPSFKIFHKKQENFSPQKVTPELRRGRSAGLKAPAPEKPVVVSKKLKKDHKEKKQGTLDLFVVAATSGTQTECTTASVATQTIRPGEPAISTESWKRWEKYLSKN
jgi:hypothetical protein